MSEVPVWEKYMLSIEEAASYFRLGEDKLRALAKDDPHAIWLFRNGNRLQIKRKLFEQYIDRIDTL